MFRGFYTVASGMIAQQRKTEMLTNNMANSNTPGYKADQSSMRAFPEMLLQRMGGVNIPTEQELHLPYNRLVGKLNTGVYMQEMTPSFFQGDLKGTERKTDVALVNVNMPANGETTGTVMFAVRGLDGNTQYTRNGNFTLDGNGFLTNSNGNYILNENGLPIQLNSDQFSINDRGEILVHDEVVTTLGIGYAEDPNLLTRDTGGLYSTEDNQPLPNANDVQGVSFQTKQGFLERSNVDPSRTMTDMLTAYRAFEANQKVLQAYDRSMEKAANEIGRVGG
ncbi:flagellar basal-body rod protein FlgG [Bacillus pakistanensis]|uniref:Flagellar basal-body rod protein FlgG n=1 Tax=Rossellomorea pakistanensis TaxID=992288 RepID=A0ABS2NBP4_9BACI|nr:flagellar hook-basal body protein [Bacillus pakistanensis]MBM7585284.1 flagellar basal-body rod protein FlgG [Bacillus pakistanensis]